MPGQMVSALLQFWDALPGGEGGAIGRGDVLAGAGIERAALSGPAGVEPSACIALGVWLGSSLRSGLSARAEKGSDICGSVPAGIIQMSAGSAGRRIKMSAGYAGGHVQMSAGHAGRPSCVSAGSAGQTHPDVCGWTPCGHVQMSACQRRADASRCLRVDAVRARPDVCVSAPGSASRSATSRCAPAVPEGVHDWLEVGLAGDRVTRRLASGWPEGVGGGGSQADRIRGRPAPHVRRRGYSAFVKRRRSTSPRQGRTDGILRRRAVHSPDAPRSVARRRPGPNLFCSGARSIGGIEVRRPWHLRPLLPPLSEYL
jgi:hypothetical protein